jgi:hypothetical protein
MFNGKMLVIHRPIGRKRSGRGEPARASLRKLVSVVDSTVLLANYVLHFLSLERSRMQRRPFTWWTRQEFG